MRRFPWGSGVVAGFGGFLAGYAGFLAVVVATASSVGENLAAVVRLVGNFFYNAHLISSEQVVRAVVQSNETGANQTITRVARQNLLLNAQGATLPVPVYAAIPAVVVVAAGVVFARRHSDDDRETPARELALASVSGGLAMAIGYLLAALLGTYVFVLSAGQGEAVNELRPDRLQTLGIAFLYPLVFGAIGVTVGQLLSPDRVTDEGTGGADGARDEPTAEESGADDT